ncbi:hypothetical protein ABT364_04600 [Massilia sp. SR12]
MKTKKLMLALVLALPLGGSIAAGSEGSGEGAKPKDIRDLSGTPYKAILEGAKAFEQNRSLAPAIGALQFIVRPVRASVGPIPADAVQIRYQEQRWPVSLTPQGTFALPHPGKQFEQEDAVLEQPDEWYTVGLWIESPSLPANVRRLGDLRLECEVGSAISMVRYSFWQRTLVSMTTGGKDVCQNPNGGYNFFAQKPLKSITLVNGTNRLAIPSTIHGQYGFSGVKFIVPLGDQSWPDETLVQFEFSEP